VGTEEAMDVAVGADKMDPTDGSSRYGSNGYGSNGDGSNGNSTFDLVGVAVHIARWSVLAQLAQLWLCWWVGGLVGGLVGWWIGCVDWLCGLVVWVGGWVGWLVGGLVGWVGWVDWLCGLGGWIGGLDSVCTQEHHQSISPYTR
jgi:hypothetical protein